MITHTHATDTTTPVLEMPGISRATEPPLGEGSQGYIDKARRTEKETVSDHDDRTVICPRKDQRGGVGIFKGNKDWEERTASGRRRTSQRLGVGR